MKHLLPLLFAFFPLAMHGQESTPNDNFFLYHLRLAEPYKNPDNWTSAVQNTISRHARFLDSLGAAGILLFAGPTDLGLEDPNLMGISIIKATSLEAARALLAPDPAVQAGIQIAQVLPYRMSIRHFQNAPGINVYPEIKISNEPENIARLQQINQDIWTPFSEAYAAGDARQYLSLHTPDFIRATIDAVEGYEVSLAKAERHFGINREKGRRCEIAFTFFERVAGAELASERGIYRYTAIDNSGGKLHFYGKFHVFHRKVDGKWKIAVDYDSDEDNTIDELDFKAALPPGVFEKLH